MNDQEIIDNLIKQDPHIEVPIKYRWDEDFQRVVMGMLLCDRFFITQSMGLIKYSYFANEVHQLTYRILIAYFEKHRQLPSKIFVRQMITDSLRERHRNQDEDTFQAVKLLYLGELTTLYDFYGRGGVGDMMPAMDSPEAILDHIVAFARTQAIREAFNSCLDIIRKDPESDATWAKVDETLKEARSVERQTDLGLDYFGTVEERYNRVEQQAETLEVFSSGFDSIDHALSAGGLCRGEIGAWMSSPGRGKSLSLVTGSVRNLVRGKKVLYISTEMDVDRIAARFDAQFSLIGHHELIPRKNEVFNALKDEVRDYEDKQRLVIKQFPSGSADVNTIKAYHAQLVMNNFRPDLVIVDYLGDMKDIPGIPTWESKFRMMRDLRGFGKVENHCTLTAIQPNRSVTELKLDEVMDETNQGGSFMQNQVLDAFWTINQTSTEQKAGLGRVHVAKHRNGRSKFTFKISYNFDVQILNLQEVTDELYRNRMNRVKDVHAEQTEVDRVIKPKWKPSEE